MPWHPRKPDPWYAIRTRKGKRGTAYRVSLTRQGKTFAALFRSIDYGSARAALKAARAWRDIVSRTAMPETKQAFSQRIRPDNTSGCPGVYLKREVVKRGQWQREYTFWQAHSPQGVKPFRSRSFSVDRYGFVARMCLRCKHEPSSSPRQTASSGWRLFRSGSGLRATGDPTDAAQSVAKTRRVAPGFHVELRADAPDGLCLAAHRGQHAGEEEERAGLHGHDIGAERLRRGRQSDAELIQPLFGRGHA
jgi:hypothetical protein